MDGVAYPNVSWSTTPHLIPNPIPAQVMNELEQQRDNLYSYTRDELRNEPPAVLETLRRQNDELRQKHATLEEELAKAQHSIQTGALGRTGRQLPRPTAHPAGAWPAPLAPWSPPSHEDVS